MSLPDSHITLHTDSITVCQVSLLSVLTTKAVKSTADLPCITRASAYLSTCLTLHLCESEGPHVATKSTTMFATHSSSRPNTQLTYKQ